MTIRVYSNYFSSFSFKPEVIKISQSSHEIYSNNILNFQCLYTKILETYWIHYVYIYIYIYTQRWSLCKHILRQRQWALTLILDILKLFQCTCGKFRTVMDGYLLVEQGQPFQIDWESSYQWKCVWYREFADDKGSYDRAGLDMTVPLQWVYRSIDCLIVWLVGWLVGWLCFMAYQPL